MAETLETSPRSRTRYDGWILALLLGPWLGAGVLLATTLNGRDRKDVASLNAGDLPGLIATTPISGMGKGRTGDREQSRESRVLGLGLTLNVDVASGKAEVINLGSPQYRLELRLLESELESTDGGA